MVVSKSLIFWVLVCFFVLGTDSQLVFSKDKVSKELKVVATTTLISSVLQEIGGGKVEVATIIPAGICPGHFDIKPESIKLFEEADILLMHGFENNLFVGKMLKLIKNPKLLVISLDTKSNCMIPDIYLEIIDKIVKVLGEAKPEDAALFTLRATEYEEDILQLKLNIQEEARNLRINAVKVVCSKMQAEFLNWLGFDIVATYGRQEDISPKELMEIIEKAKVENVKLIIDNLQSGAKTGMPIAEELKIPHLVLTNFPQEFEGNFSYTKSLSRNTADLFQAVRRIER